VDHTKRQVLQHCPLQSAGDRREGLAAGRGWHGRQTIDVHARRVEGPPRQEITSTIECSGNNGLPFLSSLVGNAQWAGASLPEMLRTAQIKSGALEVVFYGVDQGEEVVHKDTPLEIKFNGTFARSMSIDDTMNPANLGDLLRLPARHGRSGRRGAACAATLKPDGSWMIAEPAGSDELEDNLNHVSRLYYAASAMICEPTSLDQPVGAALGAQASFGKLSSIIREGGLGQVRKATETPFNMILEARR
jgi:Oxidoreductase molybdopterin binding domain